MKIRSERTTHLRSSSVSITVNKTCDCVQTVSMWYFLGQDFICKISFTVSKGGRYFERGDQVRTQHSRKCSKDCCDWSNTTDVRSAVELSRIHLFGGEVKSFSLLTNIQVFSFVYMQTESVYWWRSTTVQNQKTFVFFFVLILKFWYLAFGWFWFSLVLIK